MRENCGPVKVINLTETGAPYSINLKGGREAGNVCEYKVYSSVGNVAFLPANTVPSIPAAPTTSISGSNVIINWVAPYDGDSTITGYTVEIQQSDLITFTTYTGCTGTAVSCTVPISVLQAAPYNLAVGSSVLARV